ncbi:hypothetical protein, partial [Methylovulum sp.]
MWTIDIIGAIDRQSYYNQDYIAELLTVDLQALVVGTNFIGRPSTKIFANKSDVIKVRSELDLNADQARGWIRQALEKERHLAVHHPHKTWLLLIGHGGECLVANICPRLHPLHTTIQAANQRQKNLELLNAVFNIYFSLAK